MSPTDRIILDNITIFLGCFAVLVICTIIWALLANHDHNPQSQPHLTFRVGLLLSHHNIITAESNMSKAIKVETSSEEGSAR